MSLCKIFALLVASKHKRKRQRRKQPFISETQQKAASRKSFRGKQQPRKQGSKQQPRQQRQGKRNLFLLASLFCCLFFGKQPSKPSSKQPSSKQQRQREASQPAGRQASQCAHVVYWGARTVPAHEGIFPNPRGRTGQKMPDGNQALIRAKIVDGILADGTLTLFAEKSRSKRMNEMPCWRVANKAVY